MLLKTNSGTKMGKFKDPFTLFTIKNDKLYILNKKKLNLNVIYNLKNLLNGLNKQFSVKLSIIGLGYKINLIDSKTLILHLGFSHTIKYELPHGIIMIHPKERVSTYLLIGDEYSKLKQVALNLINLKYFLSQISTIKEVSIGHALVCDTFEFGLEQTLNKYLSLAHN